VGANCYANCHAELLPAKGLIVGFGIKWNNQPIRYNIPMISVGWLLLCCFLVWCLWMLALLGFVACLVEMPISSCNSEQAHCWVNGSFLVLLLVVQFLSDLSCQRLLLAHLPSLLLSSVS